MEVEARATHLPEKSRSQATPGMQPSSNETNGGLIMCEVEEQQAARVEVQGPNKKSDTRGTSVKLWKSVRKKQMRWASCQVLWCTARSLLLV